VKDVNGNIVTAISYFKLGQIIETSPSRKYLAVIHEGYEDWGIQYREC
jgi:hypothetical protein